MTQQDITDGFDPGDDDKIIEIFKKWKGGRLSTPLFTILSNIIPIITIETVVLRKKDGITQVLLIPRPEDDIVWKGMLHSPGASIRKADYLRNDNDPIMGVLERIETQEIKNKFSERPIFVGAYPIMVARGPEFVQAYLSQIDENAQLPDGAIWHDTNKLLEIPNFIKHQMKAIEMVEKVF